MIKKNFLILLVCSFFGMAGQELPKDSLPKIYRLKQFTTEKQISIRVGVGFQKAFYSELGLALHKCTYGDTGFFSNDFYSALEWTPNKEHNIYGLKVGYEANAFLLNLGLELKYQTDFMKKDVVITPKIGLGIFGDANIFYGYNISTNNNPFTQTIGNHQMGIIFNINNHFLNYQ
ncbi:hypothetical protein FLGE108171_00435 [Flavobacterium gelidilacus]|uniref:hypothetical protein n=1 Tax=Flavobacterium gelidilacus TaxID=206041 RepID=UPI0012F9178E|nr:hypothetical protein [Flavobacterium gelidilacus]